MGVRAFSLVSLEWDNSPLLLLLEAFFALVSLLGLGFLNTVFLSEGDVLLASTTTFLQFLILLAIAFFILEKLLERTNKDFFETVGWGTNTTKFLFALIAGAVVSFALVLFGTQALTLPVITQSTIFSPDLLTIVFVVFFAATVEEFFFRGTLLPSLGKMFSRLGTPLPGESALVVHAIIFGVFHLGAYGILLEGGMILDPRIVASMVFGLIAGIGNGLLESTGFSYSLHLTNNAFAVGLI